MPALAQRTLKVVPAPLIESVPTAPPVLEMPNPTVEYKCGNCDVVLMHVDESNAYPLIVRCLLRLVQFDGSLTVPVQSLLSWAGAGARLSASRRLNA